MSNHAMYVPGPTPRVRDPHGWKQSTPIFLLCACVFHVYVVFPNSCSLVVKPTIVVWWFKYTEGFPMAAS